MKRLIHLFFPALLFPALPLAAAQADRATLAGRGFDAFYNLEYDPALQLFEEAAALDPADPALHNHIAQALLFRELYRNGALESQIVTGSNSFVRRISAEPPPEVERRFQAEIELSLKLGSERVRKNRRDTAALHAMAVAYGLRANYGFLVHKAWSAALGDSAKAHKLDRDVTTIDPSNYDARLVQGTYDYIVGSLPWHVKALGRIAGYKGDKQRGIATLEEVAEKGRESRNDAEIILCVIYRREGQAKKAIPRVLSLTERFPRNYLIRFELAQMCGAAGARKEALEVMEEIARMKADDAPGYRRVPDEKTAYETGNLQYWFGDLEGATRSLHRATESAEGMKQLDLNTGALAFLRLGQSYDLRGEHSRAVTFYRQASEFAPAAEAAKEAKKYIGSPYRRNG